MLLCRKAVSLRGHVVWWITSILGVVFADGCARLDLLGGTGAAACAHEVETLGLLHVLKVEGARVGRADLLDGLAVLLLQLLQRDPLLLRRAQALVRVHRQRGRGQVAHVDRHHASLAVFLLEL